MVHLLSGWLISSLFFLVEEPAVFTKQLDERKPVQSWEEPLSFTQNATNLMAHWPGRRRRARKPRLEVQDGSTSVSNGRNNLWCICWSLHPSYFGNFWLWHVLWLFPSEKTKEWRESAWSRSTASESLPMLENGYPCPPAEGSHAPRPSPRVNSGDLDCNWSVYFNYFSVCWANTSHIVAPNLCSTLNIITY